ncbi:thiamine-phosphate kinase [Thiomicrorhabdus cannonii]|uniref:thiamine-phosphate kinase n=1 Tax=Thiomicrorhabdus cannonii TaxID=2748011 RepID=UPI0015B7B09A|nr:thiamine-phosphate kinase [Thiomicrorhabdus cannonii]
MAEEFRLIDRYFKPLSAGVQSGDIGIGDDGAVLSVPAGHQLVVVTDTLVSGVHFPVDAKPYDIAWKALAVNLSDLAAMAAKPGFFSLALTLPHNDAAWLEAFAQGLQAISREYAIPLIGGDTTKGPLTITVTAHGWVEQGKALLRSGAKPGDVICVSGCLGDAGLGLKHALHQLNETEQTGLTPGQWQSALQALHRPVPQLALGRALCGKAHAGIDISDGLLADLGHIVECSQARLQAAGSQDILGVELYLSELPLSAAMQAWFAQQTSWHLPLAAGDDYQLCLTMSEAAYAELKMQFPDKLYRIGRITASAGIAFWDQPQEQGGKQMSHLEVLGEQYCQANGYQHF